MNVFNSHSPAHTPHKESDQSRAKIHFGQTQQVALPQNNYGIIPFSAFTHGWTFIRNHHALMQQEGSAFKRTTQGFI
jgi:hypothetical protein